MYGVMYRVFSSQKGNLSNVNVRKARSDRVKNFFPLIFHSILFLCSLNIVYIYILKNMVLVLSGWDTVPIDFYRFIDRIMIQENLQDGHWSAWDCKSTTRKLKYPILIQCSVSVSIKVSFADASQYDNTLKHTHTYIYIQQSIYLHMYNIYQLCDRCSINTIFFHICTHTSRVETSLKHNDD